MKTLKTLSGKEVTIPLSCRLKISTYQALVDMARKRDTRPATLAAQWLTEKFESEVQKNAE